MARLADLYSRVAYAILAPFEDPTGLDRPLLRSYSVYQRGPNLDVAIANGVIGAWHRAGISWGYQDEYAVPFLVRAAAYGDQFLYATYHVIFCDQPVIRQADNWYQVQPEPTNAPRTIDLEVNRYIDDARYADATWQMCEVVKARDGMYPLIYCRHLLVNKWLSPFWTLDMLNIVWWWLAQYLTDRTREHPGPPTLPAGVQRDRVLVHQTADKKPAFPGENGAGGTVTATWERAEIGNEAEFRQVIGEIMGTPELMPPPDDLTSRVEALEVTTADIQARVTTLETRVEALESGSGNDGETDPDYRQFSITAERANARFFKDVNQAGRPIMEIYPSDTSPVNQRVQYANGTLPLVYPGRVVADGGIGFYKLVTVPGLGYPDLYLRETDGVISG